MSAEPEVSKSENSRIGEFPVPDASGGMPKNWKEALASLVSSRAEIISLEAKDAVSSAVGKIVPLLVGLVCLIATWALVLAGAIGGIAAVTVLQWYHVAFAAAGLHFLIAMIALLVAKAKKPAPFPVTRAEFEKDREWLNQLKNRND